MYTGSLCKCNDNGNGTHGRLLVQSSSWRQWCNDTDFGNCFMLAQNSWTSVSTLAAAMHCTAPKINLGSDSIVYFKFGTKIRHRAACTVGNMRHQYSKICSCTLRTLCYLVVVVLILKHGKNLLDIIGTSVWGATHHLKWTISVRSSF